MADLKSTPKKNKTMTIVQCRRHSTNCSTHYIRGSPELAGRSLVLAVELIQSMPFRRVDQAYIKKLQYPLHNKVKPELAGRILVLWGLEIHT